MKKALLCATISMFGLLLAASGQVRAEISQPPNGDNQRAEVSQWIGPVKVSIEYHSPNVHGGGGKDRTGHIWGELVEYGLFDDGFGPSHATPWRAGANESTTISFSHDVKIDGHDVKAGTYALFLELQKDGPWTWILSSQPGWGSFQYDPKYDVLRTQATPKDAPYTEFMTFSFDDRRPDSTVAFLQWEKKRIDLKIDVPNVNEIYVAEMRRDLLGWAGFTNENWSNAALFCAAHKINLDEALVWANKAIDTPFRGAVPGQRTFVTLRAKAAVLNAMKRNTEADAVMDEAIHLPGTESIWVYSYGNSLLAAGRKDKAMEVFLFNRKQHPNDTFFTSLGLARGYTALGDKPNAIKNWEAALQSVPDDRKSMVPIIQDALKGLKAGS